jgi:hypothetical protein
MVQLGGHGLDRCTQRRRDLLIRGGDDAVAVPHQRSAELAQDPLLLLGEARRGAQLAGHERRPDPDRLRLGERQQRAPDAQHVAVGQPPPPVQAHLVDPRAVLGEPVVGDRPLARAQLELGVQPRALGVPRERHVGLVAAADRYRAPAGLQRGDLLCALPIAVDQEREPEPRGGEPRLELFLARPRGHLTARRCSAARRRC